jgi:hypothetical protein
VDIGKEESTVNCWFWFPFLAYLHNLGYLPEAGPSESRFV